MKTLIVHYLPTGADSHTRQLLKLFEEVAPTGEREVLDLLETPAPTFGRASMAAYLKRNYRHEPLTEAEAALFAPQDALIAQLKAADVLVMAYPMHNFSLPAPVKAYIDAIMFIGETFDWTPAGPAPVMQHLRALTLYTSGLELGTGPMHEFPNWDGVHALSRILFEFMGFSAWESIGVSLRDPQTRPAKLAEVRRRLEGLVHQWYPSTCAV
ncbi:MAG: NAD(P)H-dependent oxidoreductase [Verrucomicrobiota bacterium JB022]|nr:NAD(P)H-dependent oxidoreductase [Verrucomicrobiota bacterium JB022]